MKKKCHGLVRGFIIGAGITLVVTALTRRTCEKVKCVTMDLDDAKDEVVTGPEMPLDESNSVGSPQDFKVD